MNKEKNRIAARSSNVLRGKKDSDDKTTVTLHKTCPNVFVVTSSKSEDKSESDSKTRVYYSTGGDGDEIIRVK